jgi:hypothetical protein
MRQDIKDVSSCSPMNAAERIVKSNAIVVSPGKGFVIRDEVNAKAFANLQFLGKSACKRAASELLRLSFDAILRGRGSGIWRERTFAETRTSAMCQNRNSESLDPCRSAVW